MSGEAILSAENSSVGSRNPAGGAYSAPPDPELIGGMLLPPKNPILALGLRQWLK